MDSHKKHTAYPLAFVLRTSLTLAYTNFKLRNERSYLGIFWYLLEPLFVFGILMMIRGTLGISVEHYALYVFLGLIMFNFFAGATNHASKAIIENAEFIKWLKIRFEIFPIAHTVQFLLSHIFELGIFFLLLIYFNVFSISVLWYVPIFFFFFLFTVGISLILATLSVFTTDLSNAWRILISRLLWLGTPIFYTLTEGSILHTINSLNPLYYFITVARDLIVYNQTPDSSALLGMILFGIVSFGAGIYIFIHQKSTIPERI